ncbi:MAG: hypothetical protein AB7U83_07630 [Vicinamibacterales bacterium]
MVVAQNLGEYGALAAFTSAASRAWVTVQSALTETPPVAWLAVAAAVAVLWSLRSR